MQISVGTKPSRNLEPRQMPGFVAQLSFPIKDILEPRRESVVGNVRIDFDDSNADVTVLILLTKTTNHGDVEKDRHTATHSLKAR